jgi:uncharacterized protein (DUF697 family)
MNRPSLLHIIERLEGFLGKLPDTIRKPVLHELTPLKELFLQQRAPRFVLTGSNKLPLQEIVATLFAWNPPPGSVGVLMELFRWHKMELDGRGTISLLDARGADARTLPRIQDGLRDEPPDILIHLASEGDQVRTAEAEIENLATFLGTASKAAAKPAVIGVVLYDAASPRRDFERAENVVAAHSKRKSLLEGALQNQLGVGEHLHAVVEVSSVPSESGETTSDVRAFLSTLARSMPNEARVETARIAGDRTVQVEIAQTLVKSTTAICGAIGAQPIPLADLPVLTALQLMMVSGVMYISGRERSLRAATEFVGALGVNVGAGMILREGTRALLKFFPGWGNVVCGAVAAAGTYAIGRASIVYFLEGLTLRDARRTYLASRKKRGQRQPAQIREIEAVSEK